MTTTIVTTATSSLSYLNNAIDKMYSNLLHYGFHIDSESSSPSSSWSYPLLISSLCGAATVFFLYNITWSSNGRCDDRSKGDTTAGYKNRNVVCSTNNNNNSNNKMRSLQLSSPISRGVKSRKECARAQPSSSTREKKRRFYAYKKSVIKDSLKKEEDKDPSKVHCSRTITATTVTNLPSVSKQTQQQQQQQQQKQRAEALLAELAFLSPSSMFLSPTVAADGDSSSLTSSFSSSSDSPTMVSSSGSSSGDDDDDNEIDNDDDACLSSDDDVDYDYDSISDDDCITDCDMEQDEEYDNDAVKHTSLSHITNSTREEQLRFLKARNDDVDAASEQLQNYLQWRKNVGLDYDYDYDDCMFKRKEEENDWMYATRLAFYMDKKQEKGKEGNNDNESESSECLSPDDDDNENQVPTLPCIIFLDENKDNKNDTTVHASSQTNDSSNNNNNRILQHLPARINPTLTPSTTLYALALAIYIDLQLSRTSTEKVTVLIDVRTGFNWSNTTVIHLLPFIKHASKLLNELHPERLGRCIIFPIPKIATFVYDKLVKPFLDVDTASKICIVSGWVAKDDTPMPKKELGMYFCEETMDRLEQRRLDCFGS